MTEIWAAIPLWLRERSPFVKIAIVILVDLSLLMLGVMLAYMLRISLVTLPPQPSMPLYLVAPFLSVLCLGLIGVYNSASRNYSSQVEQQILLSQLAVPPLWALIIVLLGSGGFARSVVIIYFILAIILLTSVRRLAAWFFRSGDGFVPRRERIPVLIYGAGAEGFALANGLNAQGRYRPVAFVDTDYTLVGRSIAGLKVSSTENLRELLNKFKPTEVMIAKPQQNRASRRALVDIFLDHGLQVKTVPGLDEIIDGKIDVNALRPINLEDLLGRDPVAPDQSLMEKALKGQVVLVTGAGGSIGSELVRQAAMFGPTKIILVDHSEFSLFEIHRDMELRNSSAKSPVMLVPMLADVCDEKRIGAIIRDQAVDVVLHAAAYKHVRMVQENAAAGIRNNVWGTKTVAEAAMENGVKLFILVSTDKAVRPTSIMGASKRVAEMVVQALAQSRKNRTVFAMVRFGNVLGSTGSVVPLFKEQIARGGPVQVTHPDVTRYFMLIPEAAQLVIQAGAMAERGEVFVLDMGESVKIVNLAETMIELAGMTRKSEANPDGDIEIVFSGLRDGEKLYEELQIGRDVSLTSNPRIMRSNEFYLPQSELSKKLSKLENLLDSDHSDEAAKLVLALSHMDATVK